MKSDAELADLFAAFAHPTRIAVLRRLLACCPHGCQFGALAQELRISPSTLTHHLDEMHQAGVLRREPVGRATILSLDLRVLTEVAARFARLCCAPERAQESSNGEPPL